MKRWLRMQKYLITGVLAICMLLPCMPAGSANTVLYAPDGRTAVVADTEVEVYTSLGWYKTYEETVKTLYAADGRQIMVYLSEVPAYLALGWYAAYAETVDTLYASDGRTIEVYKAEAPLYLALGWFSSREDVVDTLYAPDGRTMEVYKTETPAYLALGWFSSREEVVDTLYAADGRTIEVYKENAPAYLALGWSRSPNPGPLLALTFDDGPHASYTNSILNTLEAYGAKATFFVLGSQAAANPAPLRRAAEMGCEIGSHTYSHPNLSASAASTISREITNTNQTVSNIIGKKPTLLRPPYGNFNATVRSYAGVPLILWNVDTLDWKTRDAMQVAAHILSHASDGNIILMHDIYASTAEAVRMAVPELVRRGFKLVTVSELAAAKGYTLSPGSAYYNLR